MAQEPPIRSPEQGESADENGTSGDPSGHHFWHRLNAFGTTVIGGFTIVLAVLAGMQWCQMRTANKLNAGTNQPFVYVANMQATFYADHNAVVQPIWSNSGNTPTVDLNIYSSLKPFIGPMPKSYNFPDLDAGGQEISNPTLIRTLLPPKGITPGRDTLLTKDQMDQINSQAVNTYMWGWARYKDRLDIEKIHTTKFCVQLKRFIPSSIDQNGNVGFAGALQWGFCDQGNCADEECKKQ